MTNEKVVKATTTMNEDELKEAEQDEVGQVEQPAVLPIEEDESNG